MDDVVWHDRCSLHLDTPYEAIMRVKYHLAALRSPATCTMCVCVCGESMVSPVTNIYAATVSGA